MSAPRPQRAGARGRRPGGPDTRGDILAAARESFAHKGFAGTTIRGVAATAGVDAALVHHYFGSKDDLFLAALEIPVDPRAVVPDVLSPGVEGAGERLLEVFLGVWENPQSRLPLVALVRASLGEAGPVNLLRDGMLRMVFGPVAAMLPGDQPERRVSLVASQLIGLAISRYVLQLEPLASMTPDEVAAAVAPTIQRYIDGPLPG